MSGEALPPPPWGPTALLFLRGHGPSVRLSYLLKSGMGNAACRSCGMAVGYALVGLTWIYALRAAAMPAVNVVTEDSHARRHAFSCDNVKGGMGGALAAPYGWYVDCYIITV